ncbi:DUF6233 domain-containing protein [Streptomyces sp. LN245]|uniref:DUF6233 domain-containing protein n=1 Tax=Streptomyces sp. LN245 TaxID=3112975 RepID=UPI00372086AD
MPTERSGVTLAWKVEEPVHFGTQRGPARIVHRGGCRAAATSPDPPHRTARTLRTRDDATPCPMCRSEAAAERNQAFPVGGGEVRLCSC